MTDAHDNAQDDRDALEKHGGAFPRLEDRMPHPAPCNWSGGALCTCDLGLAAEQHDSETGALPWDGGGINDGRIVSIEGLDRMGDHLVAYERGIAQNQRLHDAAVKRLEERHERAQAPLRREVARIRAMVEAFAKEQGRKGICIGRLKSRTLPSGLTLSWRERKAGEYRWDQSKTPAENKAALLAWANEMELLRGVPLTREVEVPDLDRIKKFLAELDEEPGDPVGHAPPGLEYVPPGESLTVGVAEEP